MLSAQQAAQGCRTHPLKVEVEPAGLCGPPSATKLSLLLLSGDPKLLWTTEQVAVERAQGVLVRHTCAWPRHVQCSCRARSSKGPADADAVDGPSALLRATDAAERQQEPGTLHIASAVPPQ